MPAARCAAALLIVATGGLVLSAGPVGAASLTHTVIVSGLNNPRQVSLVQNNLLFVAEAGRGGRTDIGADTFVGLTGAISAVANPARARGGRPRRVVTNLLSTARRDGSFADGANGVAAASAFGPVYTAVTWAPRRLLPAQVERAQSGVLLAGRWFAAPKFRADIAGYELAHDPDHHGAASNPSAVLALPDGSQLVADTVGNDVLRIGADGRRSVFHVFARDHHGPCGSPGCDYRPTSLARDTAGHIYVGGYGAEPFRLGAITELSADGRDVIRTIRGLSSVAGVAVDRDGTVYATDQFGDTGARFPGRLIKISPTGHRVSVPVPYPAGVAVDGEHNVYVAAFSVSPESGAFGRGTSGQVWRLRL